jgi:predicted nicotinamide N-methyase
MKYPIQLTDLKYGLSVYIPNPSMVKSTYDQLLMQDAKTPFPFWAKLWASSTALTKFLIDYPNWIADKIVFEMGAGIGQPSFTIANKAKEVIISDHNNDAVAVIQTNISHLGLTNAKALQSDWNKFESNEFDYSIQADVILLSDINYAPDEFEPLQKMISHFTSNGAVIIIATPQRIMGATFIESLQEFIKHSHTESIIEQDMTVPISIYILYK